MINLNYPYSGMGPENFNKRQLLEVIRMRVKSGKNTRLKNLSTSTLDNVSRRTLINEAKRLRGDETWISLYERPSVMKYE